LNYNKKEIILINIKVTAEEYLPFYASTGAAGADLKSMIDAEIEAGERMLIPTGLTMEIPAGYEVQIRPRSGLAMKSGVTVLNSPGTIDSDYRGPVGVILYNSSPVPFTVRKGDRIAQMVVAKVEQAEFAIKTKLDETLRGDGGFGSTGI
jgi:dUTP pyrophosphatase